MKANAQNIGKQAKYSQEFKSILSLNLRKETGQQVEKREQRKKTGEQRLKKENGEQMKKTGEQRQTKENRAKRGKKKEKRTQDNEY